jgi:hypothetical protein
MPVLNSAYGLNEFALISNKRVIKSSLVYINEFSQIHREAVGKFLSIFLY